MANLYYNAAVDTAWDTLGNWWTDASFTIPSVAIPTTGDTVYLAAEMTSGPSTSVTLNHIYVNAGEVSFTGAVGNATFNDSSSNNGGTVTGDAIFNSASTNGGSTTSGTVTGNAIFNDESANGGSGSTGTVSGDAIFNDSSRNAGGTVNVNATFNDFSFNNGTVTGDATFNDLSFNGLMVSGDATFNDSSSNTAGASIGFLGTVIGTATFNNGSSFDQYNVGIVGNAIFTSLTPVTFTISSGDLNYWGQDTSAWTFATAGQSWIFNSGTYSFGYLNGSASYNDAENSGTVNGDATFSGASVNGSNSGGGTGTVTGNAIFNDTSTNGGTSYSGTVAGNATFNDSSFNYNGTVTGNATFAATSAVIQITNGHSGTYGSVTIESATPSGGDQMIARLLNLPWFINL